MKKIIVLLSLLLGSVALIAQPVSQRGTTAVTVQDARLFAQYNFRPPAFPDTLQANLQIGLDSCGALIYSRDINAYYYRACNPKRWVRVASGGNTADSAYLSYRPLTDSTFLLCRVGGTRCDTIKVNGKGVSTAWLIGGNVNPNPPTLGTISTTDINIITNNVIRAKIAGNGINRSSASRNRYLMIDTTARYLYYSDAIGTDTLAYHTSSMLNDSTMVICRAVGKCDTLIIGNSVVNNIFNYQTRLISGSAVWDSLLIYSVTACSYYINGIYYTSSPTNVTLATADPTNPRIDVIYCDTSGNVGVITGTPSANPVKPTVNPLSQIELTHIDIYAGATTPVNVGSKIIYDENLQLPNEWNNTTSDPVNINFNYTVNPYNKLKSIFVPQLETPTTITFTNNTLVNEDTSNLLSMYLLLNSTAPVKLIKTPNGLVESPFFKIFLTNGATIVTNTLGITNNMYGYISSIVGTYQHLAITFDDFIFLNPNNKTFDGIQISFATGALPVSGAQLDYITLVKNSNPPPITNNFWSLQGNDITTSPASVLGTTSNNDLNIVTNNVSRINIDNSGFITLHNLTNSQDTSIYKPIGADGAGGLVKMNNWVGVTPTLQQVLDNNHELTNGINLQGTGAGYAASLTSNVNSFGANSTYYSAGNDINAMGSEAGSVMLNPVSDVNAFGNKAAWGYGVYGTGSNANFLGNNAGEEAYNNDINGLGASSARYNGGNDVNAMGNSSAISNQGNNVNAFGNNAGAGNIYSDVNLFGKNASATASNQIVFSGNNGAIQTVINQPSASQTYTLPDNTGTLITDAPIDGNIYGRKDNAWEIVTGGSQDIDQVLSNGETANNKSMYFVNPENSNAVSIRNVATSPSSYQTLIRVSDGIGNRSEMQQDNIYIENGNTGNDLMMYSDRINFFKGDSSLLTSRSHGQRDTLPTQSGTLAISVNNVKADSSGNITLSVGGGTVTSISQGYGISNSTNPITTTGTIKVDTTNSGLSGKYLRIADTANKWVNSIFRTPGKDSIIFYIGSTRYAIKDSIGDGQNLQQVLTKGNTSVTPINIYTTNQYSQVNANNFESNWSDFNTTWNSKIDPFGVYFKKDIFTPSFLSNIQIFPNYTQGTHYFKIDAPVGSATVDTFATLRDIRNGGGTGTVTSVATGYGLSGGTITNTGTILVDTATLSGKYVPYVGAQSDVNLDTHILNAQSVAVKGTSGNGHLDLRHQSSDATATGQTTALFADASGDLKWKNDGNYYTTLKTQQTADRSYTFQNKSYTLADSADVAARVKYTDTASMLTPYLRSNIASATYLQKSDSTTYYTKYRSDTSRTNIYNALLGKQGTITLTTTGTSGASTLVGNILNIPQYSGASVGGSTGNIQYNNGTTFAGSNNLFWDNTNTRFGIAQSTPTSRLHLNYDQNSVTQSDANGILLANNTAAISGTQSISPAIVWQGNGWQTNTSSSQDVRFRADVLPVQGSTNPSATWQLASSINGGAYSNALTYNSKGVLNSSILYASSQILTGTGFGNAPYAFRTTNTGGDITPTVFFGTPANLAAGALSYPIDASNGIVLAAANGVRQIARASINITNLTNTAGSESGDMVFLTQLGGTAMSEKMRVTSNGDILMKNNLTVVNQIKNGNNSGQSTFKTTNGGSNLTPNAYFGYTETNSTGFNSIVIDFVSGNGLAFISPNGTVNGRIARAGINITNLVNTAGSESGDMVFLTQSGGTAMGEKMRITSGGGITLTATNTAAGTTGNQTINKPSGTVNIAAAGTTVTVTNSLVTANSIVFATIRTNDATAVIKNVVPAAGSFTINLNAATTAETSIGFFVINQ